MLLVGGGWQFGYFWNLGFQGTTARLWTLRGLAGWLLQVILMSRVNAHWFIRWTVPAMIGWSWILLFLPLVLLSTSTWGDKSLQFSWNFWNLQIFTMIKLPERSHPIHFQLQMGWGGSRGTQILPWKSFQIMVLTQRKYNKSVILHLYDRQAAKAFNWGTNGISILTHWLTVYGWAEAPHRSRSSGCSCPCKGILDLETGNDCRLPLPCGGQRW